MIRSRIVRGFAFGSVMEFAAASERVSVILRFFGLSVSAIVESESERQDGELLDF